MTAMARFALRHWTAILVIVVIAAWAIFYLPSTPSYAVFELKQAIDARNGDWASQYVDFQKVVRNAGYEMVENQNNPAGGAGSGSAPSSAPNILGEMIGKGAVDLFSGPMAALVKSWAVRQVNDGAKDVQMPPAAVVGAIFLLHHSGDTAYTRFTDHKNQVWEVHLAREDGAWKIVEVKNVEQLIAKLQHQQQKNLGGAP